MLQFICPHGVNSSKYTTVGTLSVRFHLGNVCPENSVAHESVQDVNLHTTPIGLQASPWPELVASQGTMRPEGCVCVQGKQAHC